MTSGARTPEELDTLLEDAFVVRDDEALTTLFEDGAVLAAEDTAQEARGMEQIAGCAAELWAQNRTYVAGPRRILQVRDTALVIADQTVAVMRRGSDGLWRYVLLSLEPVGSTSRSHSPHNREEVQP